jgi:large subunit ribosomal protein L30
MAKLEVTQTRSPIGRTQNQRKTLHTLGLKRIGDSNVVEDRPEIRGMINTIPHLVSFKTLPDEGGN